MSTPTTTITDLPAVSSLTGTEVFPVDQGATTKKGTIDQIVATATGSTVARTLANRFAEVQNVSDFGAVGDGVADDTSAIQAAIDYAAILNGGIVQLGRRHKITATLNVTHSNILVRGYGAAGSDIVGVIGSASGTTLTWSGTAGGEMIRFSSPADASAQKSRGGGLLGVYLKANSLAGVGLAIYSWNSGIFEDLLVGEFSTAGIDLGCVATLIGADTQQNIFRRIMCRQFATTGAAIRLSSTNASANPSVNLFEDIDLNINNGDGFVLYSADNNLFVRVRAFRAGGGTGNGIVFHGSNSGDGDTARANTFLQYMNAPILAKGTSSYTYPSHDNLFIALDRDNNTPEPTIETGSKVAYTYSDGIDFHSGSVAHAFADNSVRAIAARDLALTLTQVGAVFVPGIVLASSDLAESIVLRWIGTDPEFVLMSGGDVNTRMSVFAGLKVDGTQVIGTRKTGWGAPTGTATRTAFATTTVTTEELAQRVKGLIDDLIAHGLIGT